MNDAVNRKAVIFGLTKIHLTSFGEN